MKQSLFILIALLVLVGAGVTVYLVGTKHAVAPAPEENLTGQAIFTDGEHGFTIRYPEGKQTDFTFKSFYHLPPYWRSDALSEDSGSPVIAIIGYRTESDHSFPRYFNAEVRIGASKDPDELKRCLVAATDHGETELPDVTLNGTTFKAFSFQSAAMMQYLKGVSYRAIHEDTCIAVEKLETGSNYMDDPDSPDDIPQATLDAAYADLDPIVNSFTFVR